MMRDIVLLEKSLHEFEKDPIFDMLLDLSMVHLQNMKESDKEKNPTDEDCEEENENSYDEDDNTVAEAFISMKVKKLKS